MSFKVFQAKFLEIFIYWVAELYPRYLKSVTISISCALCVYSGAEWRFHVRDTQGQIVEVGESRNGEG